MKNQAHFINMFIFIDYNYKRKHDYKLKLRPVQIIMIIMKLTKERSSVPRELHDIDIVDYKLNKVNNYLRL